MVFGSFGRVTPEKQLTRVLLALGRGRRRRCRRRHLMVVGDTPTTSTSSAEVRALGLEGRVTVTGYVADADLADYLGAVDVCLNLRWPTGRETSAAWIRCLAAGKPTVISDLVAPRRRSGARPADDEVACADPSAAEPVCVGVELNHDIHMLRLALVRLAGDAGLRARLGAAARRYWEAQATLGLMAQDYESALAQVAALPDPDAARRVAGPSFG